MKILLVSPLPPPKGGIANWTERFVAYSGQYGLECQVVNTALGSDRATNFSDQKHLKSEASRTIRILKDCLKKTREFNPDIVHINSSCSPTGLLRDYLCMLIMRKRKIVFHCRCTIQHQLGTSGWAKQIFKRAVNRSECVLVLNCESAQFVKEITGKEAIKVPNFIPDQCLIHEKKIIRDSIEKLVFTGHILKSKGIDEILYAARKLPDKRFYLLGSVSEEYKDAAIPDNVVLTGSLEMGSVFEYLDESDVFVFPTYTEGFSNSLAEAMARGLPVITTDVGANADMIEDQGGIIVPVGDGGAVVGAVKSLESPEKRSVMSAWNVEKTRENYLIANVVVKLIAIYKKVLDS